MSFEIKNTTKERVSTVGFEKFKDQVLGKKYECSLVFCGPALSRSLNRTYRDKDKATNVLAFEIAKNSGEIFINLKKTRPFGIKYLFIHGLLHLKGMEHGDRMERAEQKLLNGATTRSRN